MDSIVDTPVPYRLADLIEAIAEKDREMVQGKGKAGRFSES